MPTKQEDIIKLANKGGNDASLLLLDKIHKLEEELEAIKKELEKETPEEKKIERIASKLAVKMAIQAEEPSDEELLELIKPLIPEVKDGEDYILTEIDKKEIADKIKVPIVEKIIEKTEVIKEQPIITNEIKEVAVAEKPEMIRDKLETLKGKERLDISAIEGLEEKIKAIPERPTTTIFGGRIPPRYEKFSFTGDGSTTAFTLPHVPAGKGLAIWAYYNGQWLQPTTHLQYQI